MNIKKSVISIFIIILLSTGGIFFFMSQRTAYTLTLPAADSLTGISFDNETIQREITDMKEIEDIIYVLDGGGRTTKKESINDSPVNIGQPVKVELKSAAGEDSVSVLYIYEDDTRYYLEQPYNGIYQISGDEYNSIIKYIR